MDFRIERDRLDPEQPTLGRLYAGDLELYTLEPPWKDNEAAVSCIPSGDYRVVLAWSNRFQKLMPRLLDVPGRSGILIHPLNYVYQTQGCIGVGLECFSKALLHSRDAFDLFYHWLGIALRSGDVHCTITSHDNNLEPVGVPRQFQTP